MVDSEICKWQTVLPMQLGETDYPFPNSKPRLYRLGAWTLVIDLNLTSPANILVADSFNELWILSVFLACYAELLQRPPICPACVCCEPPPPRSCCRCCAITSPTSVQSETQTPWGTATIPQKRKSEKFTEECNKFRKKKQKIMQCCMFFPFSLCNQVCLAEDWLSHLKPMFVIVI